MKIKNSYYALIPARYGSKSVKINRSLVSKFQKKYNVKVSSWDKMILDMKKQINENI